MTKLSEKPLVRQVETLEGTLVLEMTSRLLSIRPVRSRDPEAKVEVPWESIYRRCLMAKAEQRIREKKRK